MLRIERPTLQRTESFIVLGLFLVSFIAGIVLANVIYSLNNLTGIALLEEYKPEIPTKIFDDKNVLISEYFLQKRILLSFKDLPDNLIKAIIVKEDREFYSHGGINPGGIARAFLVNLFAGKIKQGGSTLTQQLAKVLFTSRKRSYLRKIREVWLALQIEKLYTKNEIIEMYFNQIYFGHGAYGVESASRFYFNKPATDLTFAECALLAIMPNAPNYFSPIRNPEVAQKQQWRLIRQMSRLGYITPADAREEYFDFWTRYLTRAKSDQDISWNVRVDHAPYFTEYIRRKMNEKYGEKQLYGEGLRIYTTLDLTMQRYAQDTVTRSLDDVNGRYVFNKLKVKSFFNNRVVDMVDLAGLLFNLSSIDVSAIKTVNKFRDAVDLELNEQLTLFSHLFNMGSLENFLYAVDNQGKENSARQERVEGALVSLEPRSGKIRALVGGSTFNAANQLNRAVQMRRQAGSSFKPFVYATAIGSGFYTAGSVLEDAPIVYFDKVGKEWIPNNYGGQYAGKVTLRRALEKSINIISIKLADTIGLKPVQDLSARMLHIISEADRLRRVKRDLSLALGTMEVSPLEMATAYSIFANGGKDVVPYSVKRVEDRYGNLIEDDEKDAIATRRPQIVTPQVSYIISEMLKSVLQPGGTAYRAIRDTGFTYDASGKTGTTDNWKDAWFIGYTPELCTAVWVGFDNYSLSLGIDNTGGQVAAPIWSTYMYKALSQYPRVTSMTQPAGVVERRICAKSGLLSTSSCPAESVYEEWFVSGSEPDSPCDVCTGVRKQDDFEMNDIPLELLKKHKPKYNNLLQKK